MTSVVENIVIWLAWFSEACIVLLIFWAMYRARTVHMLLLLLIVVVVANGLPVPFVRYTMPRWGLETSTEPALRATLAILIFTSVALAGLAVGKYHRFGRQQILVDVRNRRWMLLGVTLLLAVLSGRFLFLSDGIAQSGAILSAIGDFDAYYTARAMLSAQLVDEPGRGFASFNLAAMLVAPVVVSVAAYRTRWTKEYWIEIGCFVTAWGVLLAHAIVTVQKAAITIGLLFPIICWVLLSGREGLERRLKPSRLPWIAVLSLVVMAAVSVWTVGLSPHQAILTVVDRLTVVTAETADLYYQAFPDHIPFRGLDKIWFMMNDYQVGSEQDVTFEEVAQFGTGVRFSANGNFLAIAYSGFGFLGVFIVSVVLVAFAVFVDWLMRDFALKTRWLVLLPSSVALVALTNTPFLSAVIYYGLWLSLAVALGLRFFGSPRTTSFAVRRRERIV